MTRMVLMVVLMFLWPASAWSEEDWNVLSCGEQRKMGHGIPGLGSAWPHTTASNGDLCFTHPAGAFIAGAQCYAQHKNPANQEPTYECSLNTNCFNVGSFINMRTIDNGTRTCVTWKPTDSQYRGTVKWFVHTP